MLVKASLLVLGGIAVFNVVAIAGLAVSEIRDRRRRGIEVRYLQALWHVDRHHPLHARRVGSSMARAPFRPWGGKPLGVAMIGVTIFAGSALASTGGRRVATAVLTSVAKDLGLRPAEADVTVTATESFEIATGPGLNRQDRRDDRSTVQDDHDGGGSDAAGADAGTAPDTGGEIIPPSPDPTESPPVLLYPKTVVAIAVSSSQIDLDWTDVSGETGYLVERTTGHGWKDLSETGADVTSHADTGLEPGTTYTYQIVAIYGAEDSPASREASATTAIDPPGSTTLEAVVLSPTEVRLTWADVATETGYRIERSLDGAAWTQVGTAGQGATTFTDTGLSAGTTYYYRVVATNSAGDSPASNAAQVTTSPDVPAATATPDPDRSDRAGG